MINKLIQCDCMEYMKTCKDKQFDLAIVDPPYFDEVNKLGYYGNNVSSTKVLRHNYKPCSSWKVPDNNYYAELCRISKNQIIWGINYFHFINVPTGRIVWDKKKNESCTFSDGEIASCSLIDTVRFFRYTWDGMLQENMKNKETKIHPTQKPVALYKWLLSHYAHAGDKLFDSHSGSGSFRIAAYDMGFDLVSCEIDAVYCRANEARYQAHIAQQELIPVQEIQQLTFGEGKIRCSGLHILGGGK